MQTDLKKMNDVSLPGPKRPQKCILRLIVAMGKFDHGKAVYYIPYKYLLEIISSGIKQDTILDNTGSDTSISICHNQSSGLYMNLSMMPLIVNIHSA